jgi:O-methyltransferase
MIIDRMKAGVQGLLRRFGCQLVHTAPLSTNGHGTHEEIRPWATYAPWNADPDFVATYNAIKDHTLVDLYRCWELWTLVGQSAKLDRGGILEIGVWRGGTGAIMARKAALCGIKEPVYLCDTFTGVVKAGSNDTRYRGGEHADTSRRLVETLTRETLKLTNVEILEGIFPDQTAHQIEGRNPRFRLCHIDVDVYQSAKDVLDWVWGRTGRGGVIVYDDYGFRGCEGITKIVHEQLGLRDRLVLHNLNGHAVVIKLTDD